MTKKSALEKGFTRTLRTQVLGGAALPAAEDMASEVERVTQQISGANKLQNNSTEIANALRSKAMTQFLRSAVKFLFTTGTSLEL